MEKTNNHVPRGSHRGVQKDKKQKATEVDITSTIKPSSASPSEKELIIERLKQVPDNWRLCIG